MLLAGEKLAAEGMDDIGFLFVAGEETSSDGAKKAAELGLETEYIILGEPTDNRIAASQKGTLVFRLEIKGQAGHSALPSSGRSAVHKMAAVLKGWLDSDWGSDPSRGENTLNIGTVRGGMAPNVIAPGCAAEGIFRVATSVEDVRNIMTRDIEGDADIEIAILSSAEPLDLTRVPGLEHTVVSFGSDAPFLSGIARVIMCGPARSGTPILKMSRFPSPSSLRGRGLQKDCLKPLNRIYNQIALSAFVQSCSSTG